MTDRSKPQVLFVDDDILFLRALARILRHERFDCVLAENSNQAFQKLRETEISVVVSDLRMPEQDGLSFLAQVSRHYPTVTRILLSGNLSLETAKVAVNRGGASRLLEKPVREMDLISSIRGALAESEHRKSTTRTMELVQMQSSYIEHLEKEFPGITRVEKDGAGCVVLPDPEE